MVLFGAGASFGAGWIVPEPPPLGTTLFHELSRLYPGSWGGLRSDIREQFRTHFELGMGQLVERAPLAVPQLMRELAVYFVQFRAADARCLYSRLIDDLRAAQLLDSVCFSTLNYDCVLDFVLRDKGVALDYFADPSSEGVPLLKLHGSSNMFAREIAVSQDVLYGTGVTFEGGVQAFLDSSRVIEHALAETGLAPVMCLYMRGKPLNISPSALSVIQAAWQRQVQAAKAVLVVGVRPWPEDEHVWGPLSSTSANLDFVCDENEVRAWAAAGGRQGFSVLGARFSDSYDRILERITRYAAH